MRITLLGHASILVEMGGAVCLMDPVFYDPFEEGAVTSCPRRTVHPEKLPPIDLLVLSHRHPDHFDIASLSRLPRDCDAICPADPLIIHALRELGFARIHPVHTMAPISSGDFELYPTRSEAQVREFGMVFSDSSGVFWNQVDSLLSAATIRGVAERFARVDLLFAMYASQNFEFFESHATSFPFESHRQNLETALRINPRMVAPGSAGFRFCGDHAWLNRFLFPISPRRFADDLQLLAPHIAAQVMMPGDVFELSGGEVRYLPAASEVALTNCDDGALIEFDPAAPIPDLNDPNPEGYSADRMLQTIGQFIGHGLAEYAARAYQGDDPLLRLYRQHRVRYEIVIVLPDTPAAPGTAASRQRTSYRFEFGEGAVRITTGVQSVRGEADMCHRIAASALVGWIERRKSFFYVRAYSRRSAMLYEASANGGHVGLRPIMLPDLLMHYLLNVAAGSETAAKRRVDLELAALLL
ncbi:MAG: MBL fold metallo-hydrolase [Candidatus Binataceae bacterium]